MNVRIWGTRGSIPAPGPSTMRYGGNTSCVEVRLSDGTLIILDAGTGIRAFGASQKICRATVLLTHYHWDHIQGMPFFSPAFNPASEIEVFGPEFEGAGPDDYLSAQMMAPYFPAAPSQMRGVRRFGRVPSGPFRVGGAAVRAARVCHPGVTFGYRIDDSEASLVYISDNEPGLASPRMMDDIVGLSRGADLLIHDCQFTPAEYESRRGWGHSTPEQAVGVARNAGVRTLMLFHHDPARDDEQVEAMAEDTRAISGNVQILIGREGSSIDLAAHRPEGVHVTARGAQPI